MTELERQYFSQFTIERLRALRRSVAREAKNGGEKDRITELPIYNGGSYVTKKWLRKGGKTVLVHINKRKVDKAIKERLEKKNES